MSETESNTLYNVSNDNINKWLFRHTGIPTIKEYDNNINNCCTCLDCCTWCLEFHINKYSICKNPTICYLCCFSIYFT